jgi:hypothetical protein
MNTQDSISQADLSDFFSQYEDDAFQSAVAKEDKLADGWFMTVAKDNEFKLNKAGTNMQFVTTVQVLSDPSNEGSIVKGVTLRSWTPMPRKPENSTAEELKKQKFAFMKLVQFMHAYFPNDVPDYPRYADGKLSWNGQEIEPSEKEACIRQSHKLALEAAQKLAQNPKLIVGGYASVEVKDDPNSSFGPGIRRYAAELPNGESYVDPNHVMAQ